MKATLLVLMAVVVVGCSKENPPWPGYGDDDPGVLDGWYDSLVVCLHCGSDLARKGAQTCAECGRDQR